MGRKSILTSEARFRYEKELQTTIATLDLDLKYQYAITFMRREVPLGGCIPDIIYVRFNQLPDFNLWPRKLSFRHIYIIWLLRCNGEMAPRDVASQSYSPLGRINRAIDDLIKSNALAKTANETIKLTEAMLSVHAEVIAVEAKLRDWRQALEQAEVYATFAHKVFVAMDSNGVPQKMSSLDEFKKRGVGLCSLTPSSDQLEWQIEPKHIPIATRPFQEYLIASAVRPENQTAWSCRYNENARCQALTCST